MVGHYQAMANGDVVKQSHNVAAPNLMQGPGAEAGVDQPLKRRLAICPSAQGKPFTRKPVLTYGRKRLLPSTARITASFNLGPRARGQ
ncbi:MAG: hypothetical protein WBE62_03570 [Methylocella sp.]